MTKFKFLLVPALLGGFMAMTGLISCAHHELSSPVQSMDAPYSNSSSGPIERETIDPNNKTTHSSMKTPKSADFGAPTGSVSGSGATP